MGKRAWLLAAFTREVIATRGDVSDGTYATFKAAGFTEGQALEVILCVSPTPCSGFAERIR